jgi:hypothetical protein
MISSVELTQAHFRLIGRAVKRFGWPIYPLRRKVFSLEDFTVLDGKTTFWYNSPCGSSRIEQENVNSNPAASQEPRQ